MCTLLGSKLGDPLESLRVDVLLSISVDAVFDRRFSVNPPSPSGWLREARPVFGVFTYGVCLLESQGDRADLEFLFLALRGVNFPTLVELVADVEGVVKASSIL